MTTRIRRTRPPAVAGLFYPDDVDELDRVVDAAFARAVDQRADAPIPEALIVPHAGLHYSGPIAASGYRRLQPARHTIDRVVLMGPSHRVPLDGLAVPLVDAFETPLGRVLIDDELRETAIGFDQVVADDRPHDAEHSLEVQLPFLQTVLGEFELLPLAVGDATPDEVAEVLDAVWGGPETVVVVSTDLSHFHGYDDARRVDARTAASIVAADVAGIRDDDVCGAVGLRGFLVAATRRGLTVEQLDLRSSGDTAGDRQRVVGYGAFAIG